MALYSDSNMLSLSDRYVISLKYFIRIKTVIKYMLH